MNIRILRNVLKISAFDKFHLLSFLWEYIVTLQKKVYILRVDDIEWHIFQQLWTLLIKDCIWKWVYTYRYNIRSHISDYFNHSFIVIINIYWNIWKNFAHKYIVLLYRMNVQRVDESNSLQRGLLYKYSQMLMKVWQICRKCLYCSHSVYTIMFVISHIHTHKLQNVTHGWLRNLVSWR